MVPLGNHGDRGYWLHVAIIPDELYEGDETFFLVLSSSDPAVVFSLSVAEVTIHDDDAGTEYCISQFKSDITTVVIPSIQLSLGSSRMHTLPVRVIDM